MRESIEAHEKPVPQSKTIWRLRPKLRQGPADAAWRRTRVRLRWNETPPEEECVVRLVCWDLIGTPSYWKCGAVTVAEGVTMSGALRELCR